MDRWSSFGARIISLRMPSLENPRLGRYPCDRTGPGLNMREWIDLYDSDHPIYVNARHRDVHFRDIATDILQFLPGPNATVLDFSCGEALHADIVADKAA